MTSPPPPPPRPASLDPPKPFLHPVHVKTSSPRYPPPPATPTPTSSSSAAASRRIAIAVDLSNESAFAVRWALDNYLRPGDTVILLHVRSTSVLYGADWGSTPTAAAAASAPSLTSPETSPRRMMEEEEIDSFTAAKAGRLAQPLADAGVPFKIHVVKDHDMKERLCLEVERLGLSAVVMGSRGIGALRRSSKGKLGSVSDYCVQHCACPVVVVRYNQEEGEKAAAADEQNEFHDASDQQN